MENTVENNEGIVLDDAVLAPETQDEAKQQAEPAEQQEPGWFRARINDAVRKAEDRLRADYEAKLAPLREVMMERQAMELVEQGEFKSLERAKEYVRMKGGYSEPPAQEENEDPYMAARADVLARQAEKIKANRGLDVMAVFNDDPDVKQRILSGEWDFYDVADAIKKNPPAPMRSPNGIGVNAMSIQNMTDEQFKKLQANLANGRKYDMRK